MGARPGALSISLDLRKQIPPPGSSSLWIQTTAGFIDGRCSEPMNGGHTWKAASQEPCFGVYMSHGAPVTPWPSFVDSMHGWVLCGVEPVDGYTNHLFTKTEDGGDHWQVVAAAVESPQFKSYPQLTAAG